MRGQERNFRSSRTSRQTNRRPNLTCFKEDNRTICTCETVRSSFRCITVAPLSTISFVVSPFAKSVKLRMPAQPHPPCGLVRGLCSERMNNTTQTQLSTGPCSGNYTHNGPYRAGTESRSVYRINVRENGEREHALPSIQYDILSLVKRIIDGGVRFR